MKTIRDIHFQGDFHHLEIADDSLLNIGYGVTFRSFASLEVSSGAQLEIGNGVFFNDHCSVRCSEKISIGRDTMFGDGVRIFDANHKYNAYQVAKTSLRTAPIHIGRDCWIGANVVILKGVTIGDNVIVGANSLIYKDIPSNSVVTHSEELVIKPREQARYHAFTYTYSDQLEELSYLLENLPEVDFHVAAPSNASPYLESFDRFSNFHLYTYCQDREVTDRLLEQADVYLDINHWDEVDGIVQRAFDIEKEVLAFETVCHRRDMMKDGSVFSSPEEMVSRIKDIINE